MIFARRTHRLLAWLALATILAASLMPLAAQAMAHWRGSPAANLSACGMDMSAPQASAMPAHAPQHHSDDGGLGRAKHCPFCTTHAGADGLPPAAPDVLPATAESHRFPPRFFQARRTLFAWSGAQPRAPPFPA